MKKRTLMIALVALAVPLTAASARTAKVKQPKMPPAVEAPPAPPPVDPAVQEAAMRAARLDAHFREMDGNGDGTISRAEFDAFHTAMEGPKPMPMAMEHDMKGPGMMGGHDMPPPPGGPEAPMPPMDPMPPIKAPQ